MYDVFISYSSEERRSVVQPIVDCLSKNGLQVWYDDERLIIGDNLLEWRCCINSYGDGSAGNLEV